MMLAAGALVFDLACSGFSWSVADPTSAEASINAPAPRQETRPFRRVLRVDLDRGRWCFDDSCGMTYEFARVTPDTLVFSDGCAGAFSTLVCIDFRVDRETAGFRYRDLSANQPVLIAQGHCTKLPSKGLPRPKF